MTASAYAAKVQERFRDMGLSLTSIHDLSNMPRAVDEADVIFVGGGNTFRLFKGLYDYNLLGPIRRRVAAGVSYIGSSAGSSCGLSDSENNKGHARSAASILRGFGPGSIPDQSALLGP